MSNNISMDFGFDMGDVDNMNDANNTFFKLKLGKGAEDAMALKQIVEAGTGRTLSDSDHYISIKVPESANLEELKEMVDGFAGGDEGLVEEVAGKDGYKWLMVSLKKVNEGQEMGDINQLEEELAKFFDTVKSNAFLEMFVKSSHHFSEAMTVAEQNNERTAEEPTGDELCSLAVFAKGISGHFKADIDHDFVLKVAEFAKNFCPVTPQLFEFAKKMNNIEMNLKLNSIDEVTGECKKELQNEMWSQLMEFREVFEDVKSFVSCLDDLRVFFVLKDSAYMSLEVRAPGLANYVKYFAPDEE